MNHPSNQPLVRTDVLPTLIIGSGPAGLTAAIYLGRTKRHPVVISGNQLGGQLSVMAQIDNYPGFADGVAGYQLFSQMRAQAEKFGAVILNETVVAIDFSSQPHKIWTKDLVAAKEILDLPLGEMQQKIAELKLLEPPTYQAKTVIIATGANRSRLNLPNEESLIGRGISFCATCDAPFFNNKTVAVAGGGNAALEEALVLSKFAQKIYLLVRRQIFRADRHLQEQVLENPKIEVLWQTTIKEIKGSNRLESLVVETHNSDSPVSQELAIDGLFIAIGSQANSSIFHQELELAADGRLQVNSDTTLTNKAGIFAAGDIEQELQQLVIAEARGAQAAMAAETYLSELS